MHLICMWFERHIAGVLKRLTGVSLPLWRPVYAAWAGRVPHAYPLGSQGTDTAAPLTGKDGLLVRLESID
jgi:hypothetical protein